MTARINVRVLSAASAFASKEAARYYLNGVMVHVEERSVTYVATDGHRLICYRDDLPENEDGNSLSGQFIIPTDQCRAHKASKDCVAFGEMSLADDRLTISFLGVDVTFTPIDGTFPDWLRVVPQGKLSGAKAHFNFLYLADFTKFARAIGAGSPQIVSNGEKDPAFIWFAGHDEVFGVLMPVRSSDESGRTAPVWARRTEDTSAQAA